MSNPLVDFAEDFGMRLFPWQRAVLDAWMADRTLVLTLPRKHGRTSVKQAMERARDQYRASMHVVDVAQIMRGEIRPQLTTGAGRPCPALAWWGEPEPHVEPCRCTYGFYRVAGAPGPYIYVRRPGMRRPDMLTAAFRIAWFCPHHGRGSE